MLSHARVAKETANKAVKPAAPTNAPVDVPVEETAASEVAAPEYGLAGVTLFPPGGNGDPKPRPRSRFARAGAFGRTAGLPTAPPILHEVLRSFGQPLDSVDRAFFEARFGERFDKVRVHTDPRAAASARAVNSLAYTVGQQIVFASGQYSPQSRSGRNLLAHELTHVRQQRSAMPAGERLEIGDSFDAFEQEAETGGRSENLCSPQAASATRLGLAEVHSLLRSRRHV